MFQELLKSLNYWEIIYFVGYKAGENVINSYNLIVKPVGRELETVFECKLVTYFDK